MGARTLVTGGCGFIGRHLVRLLCTRGASVRVLDLAPAPLGADVDLIEGSILDADLVREAMKGVERVYHLAGNPNLWAARKDDFYQVNTEGTRVVLEAARRQDVERFVFTSTESILKGKAKKARLADRPTDERISLSLADMPGPYCRSKYLAEELAMKAAAEGLPLVVVNPTLPIGPGDRGLTPPSRMLLGFLRGEFPAYLDCEFNMIDVRDAALGHVLAAERGRVGERYILGGENLGLGQVVAMLADLTGRPMPKWRVPYWLAYLSALVGEALADHVTKRRPTAPLTGVRLARTPMYFDCSKAEQELGLSPRPIRQALEDAIAWFEAEGYLAPGRASDATMADAYAAPRRIEKGGTAGAE